MTKEEFCSLPLSIALAALYEVNTATLAHMTKPAVPRPPKYDDRFSRKKGHYCWMSEMTLDDLTWWRGKKAEGAAGGGQYAEADGKAVAKLDKWIEWRRVFPSELWSGTRGDDRATGKPPSRDAELHPWGERSNGGRRPPPPDDGWKEPPADEDFGF